MAANSAIRTSIHGRRLGLGSHDQLIGSEMELTSPAADCTITIAASITSPRTVVVQLVAPNGAAFTEQKSIEFEVYADSAGAAFAVTGGSTGLASDGTAGVILALVAKKKFA